MSENSSNPSKWIAFADGACSGNPGPGGWGSILASPKGWVREYGGFEPGTTNNQMELRATLEALRDVPQGECVEMNTDSTYVIKGITQWIWNWIRNGWKTTEGKDISNRALWERLSAEVQRIGRSNVKFSYVPGHAGVPGNERVDLIAVSYSKRSPAELYDGFAKTYPVDLSITVSAEIKPSKLKKPNAAGSFDANLNQKVGPTVYLSLIGSLPERHTSWAECERRVKGQSGARFKKVQNRDEEIATLTTWGVNPDYFLRAGQ